MRFFLALLPLSAALLEAPPAAAARQSLSDSPLARHEQRAGVPTPRRHKSRALAEQRRAEAAALRARWTVAAVLRAAKVYEDSARHWRDAGDVAEVARTFLEIGHSYTSISMHREALAPYDQARLLYKGAGDRRGEVAARNGVGAVYAFLGRNQEAETYCRETLSLAGGVGDARLHAQALHNLGDVSYNFSRMEDALGYFNQALGLWREAGERRGEAQTLTRVGYIHMGLSDMARAEEAYNKALSLWRGSGDRRGLALNLTALGNLYNKLEEKQRALNFYYEAAEIFRPMGDPYGEATTLTGVAYVYERIGNGEAALSYYSRALPLYRRAGHRLGEAVTLFAIGRIHNSFGRHRQALEHLRPALSVSQLLSDPLVTSFVVCHLGEVYDAQGDKQQALKYHGQALELSRVANDRRQEAYILNYMGAINRSLGEPHKAARLFKSALELNRIARDPGGESLTRYNLARVLLELGDLDESHRQVKEALEISESLRAKVAGQESRALYFASVHRLFDLHIEVQMRLHKQRPAEGFDVAAFETSERGRARSLLETLAEGRKDIRQGVDAQLLKRENELRLQLGAKAERRIQLVGGNAPDKELAAVEEELGALTTEYQHVQGQIKASSRRYAGLVLPVPLTLTEIQQKVLSADTVLLEYALGTERSFVWVVMQDSLKSFELPPRAEVERAARHVYATLTERNRQVNGETGGERRARHTRAEEQYAQASRDLSAMLLGPIASELQQKHILIVADGALQYVPFAALPVPPSKSAKNTQWETDGGGTAALVHGSSPDSRPLIVDHEVVSLPSASVMALIRDELRGRQPARKSVAVLADPVFDGDERLLAVSRPHGAAGARERRGNMAGGMPDVAAGVAQRALRDFDGLTKGVGIARLPFSRREAEAIMALVPAGDGMLALGFRASRATATGPELSQYRIVHFATHGLLNSEHPELSGIVLSLFDEAGRRQEGFLQLYEVYNLDLPADLVVLSACQTALGKEIRGEGLVGLTRGFMYAGAARVVASLWKVDDGATAELMGEFYRAMFADGLRPAAALRTAQIRMWRQNRWRSPYYWAAFTLQGEWK